MYKTIRAKVFKETRRGTYFIALVSNESLTDEVKKLSIDGILTGAIRFDDSRCITVDQRKKAYATLRDISDWNGDLPEALKEDMKYEFIAATGEDYFSLSSCSVSTARLFINFLTDFAMKNGVPLRDTALNRTDDINAAIYSSLKHKRCIVCGCDGEVHNWDAIGKGRDGRLRKLCLCRKHCTEFHQMCKNAFEIKYRVYGIVFNE